MSSTRDAYVKTFGEEQAAAIENAAQQHLDEGGTSMSKKGSDPFKWALAITIGWQCFEVDQYRKHHGITPPYETIKDWIIEFADIASHDGDFDILAAFAGKYEDYIRPRGRRIDRKMRFA